MRLRHGQLAALSLRGCGRVQSLSLAAPGLGALVLEECSELGRVALAPAGLTSLSLGAFWWKRGKSAVRWCALVCRWGVVVSGGCRERPKGTC